MDEESKPLLSAKDGKIHPSGDEVKICPDKCEKYGTVSRRNNYQAVTDVAEDGGDGRLETLSQSIVLCKKNSFRTCSRGIPPLFIDSRVQNRSCR